MIFIFWFCDGAGHSGLTKAPGRIYLYKCSRSRPRRCSRSGPRRSQCHPELNQLSLKMAQKGSKKRKKAQKGSKRRSKRLFEPARCRQCARRGCSSLLRCRLCVRRGCSRLLFEITIRKCWARLHCALSHCTLLCFAPCMYMHGSTLVVVMYTRRWICVSPDRVLII